MEQTASGAIEPLVCTENVRSWRVGTSYDIAVSPEASDEEWKYVLNELGLVGRTDFEVSYIPETGMEIYRLEMFGGLKLRQKARPMSIGVGAVVVGLISDGNLFDVASRLLGA